MYIYKYIHIQKSILVSIFNYISIHTGPGGVSREEVRGTVPSKKAPERLSTVSTGSTCPPHAPLQQRG